VIGDHVERTRSTTFIYLGGDQIADYALSSNGVSGRVLMCKISCSVRLGEGFV